MKSAITAANGGPKLILLHKQQNPQPPISSSHRLSILFLLSFLTLACTLLTLSSSKPPSNTAKPPSPPLPASVADALIHYAASTNTTAPHMSPAELHHIAATLRSPVPTNLLVFGLTHETLLWHALNSPGRTTFLDENAYHVSQLELRHPDVEAYDVQYTTRVADLHPLLASARRSVAADCRPVQNLLFSDCQLGLNDLPNFVYDLHWHVILVDGPSGYKPDSPGRMSAIFTAAVLARTNGAPNSKTHVFVRDYNRDVERISSLEFLCQENLVEVKDSLAHFVIERKEAGAEPRFCRKSGSAPKTPLSGFEAS
uniref:Polysaccharide biosynthesis domain-containing protein n=1 Tax=Kalanchoe fedtschenkoi TaxID=63787 RepID=A0A7N0ZRV4_KALFE